MRLILLGPPGSGKGTQAILLSERLGLVHVGTGDILREAVRNKTSAGKLAEPYVLKGQLVPDSLVNDLVNDRFNRDDRPEQFVTDGYPRTLAQAASFDQVLRQQFLDLCGVIFLDVDDEEIVRRLSGRWVCPICKTPYHMTSNPPKIPGRCDMDGHALIQRSDDREEIVRNRLRTYRDNTTELIPYYQARALLHEVSGLGGIENVYVSILQALNLRAGPPC
jgi:adenylate kinase